MADRASSSITVDAPRAEVMRVISDIAAYPEWVGSMKKTEVLETGPDGRPARTRMTLDAGVVKDEYVLAYTWEGDDRVSWTLLEGQMQKAQEGSYTLTDAGSSTKVVYELEVTLTIPMLGMFKRKAEKVIMDNALKELKKRAESA